MNEVPLISISIESIGLFLTDQILHYQIFDQSIYHICNFLNEILLNNSFVDLHQIVLIKEKRNN